MMKLTKSSRAFRRATAFVLAAALTFSAPVATSASAATKKVPSLSVKKKTLYFNKAGKKSFTLKVKKNKVKKIVSTKWSTSKKTVAKISKKKKTSVKVTAKAAGTAKIKAVVKYKAGSKVKTKKLTCKVTSKKYTAEATTAPTSTAVVTEAPATEAPATEAPTEAPATEAPTEAPVETEAPATEAPTEAPAETEAPTPVIATVSSISAIDATDFAVTLSFSNAEGEVTADVLKDAKLTLKKDSIEVTASFEKVDEQGSAVFKIDDSSALRNNDNREADGTYTVTSSSESLVVPAEATTTYEEAKAGMSVEGYVMTINSTGTQYEAVKGAVVSIKGGKSTTTDSEGYYRIATTAGKKTMSVEATAALTGTDYINRVTPTGSVSINRNHPTSQNFVLAKYDVNKVYLDVHAVNSKDETTNVVGATAVLKDAAGKVVADGVVTDSNGKVAFANNTATGYTATNVKTAAANTTILQRNTTYTIELEKKLSSSNLKDVYKIAKEEVTIGGDYANEVTVKMIKVAELPSMTITSTYGATTAEGAKAAPLTGTATDDVYNTYELYYNNGTANAELLLSAEQVDSTVNASKQTADDLIAKIADLNKATLPTGTYYVVVKGYDDNTYASVTDSAFAVAEVNVAEGVAATAAVTRTKGCTRELTTNIGLREAEEATQKSAVAGDNLRNIINTNGLLGAGSTSVNANNALYQVMTGDVLVPVQESSTLYVVKTANNTWSAPNTYTNILGTATYTIKSVSNYSKSADYTFAANEITNQQVTINAESKWNLIQIDVKAQTGDVLVGNTAPDLKAIRVLDSTGAVVSEKTYATTIAAKSSALLGNGDFAQYEIPAEDFKLLDRGSYKVEVTLVNCNPVTSALTAVVGLEDVTAVTTEKVTTAVNSDKTTIAGTVKYAMNDGSTKKANASSDVAQIIVLNAAGKIAGAATTDTNGKYSVVDGTNQAKLEAGTYTVVARSADAETYSAVVTVADKQNLALDIVMAEGANGSVKAVVTDTYNNAISGFTMKAYDSLYASTAATNWASGTAGTISEPTLAGEYEGAFVTNGTTGATSATEFEISEKLSVGSYTLKFGGVTAINNYNMGDQVITITDLGQKVYPKYAFDVKATSAGDGKVNLVVAHGDLRGHESYVVVVKNEDGTSEAIAYNSKYGASGSGTSYSAPNDTIDPEKFTTLRVTSNKNYTVSVYTGSGNYVATKNVTVQAVESTVEFTYDNAAID